MTTCFKHNEKSKNQLKMYKSTAQGSTHTKTTLKKYIKIYKNSTDSTLKKTKLKKREKKESNW